MKSLLVKSDLSVAVRFKVLIARLSALSLEIVHVFWHPLWLVWCKPQIQAEICHGNAQFTKSHQCHWLHGFFSVVFEVLEIICWSNRMIPSCTKWWLSFQELPDFHNLGLCFYFLSKVCTYWSYRAFPRSNVTAVTLVTERCFCFWLSSSELFRKAFWKYIS